MTTPTSGPGPLSGLSLDPGVPGCDTQALSESPWRAQEEWALSPQPLADGILACLASLAAPMGLLLPLLCAQLVSRFEQICPLHAQTLPWLPEALRMETWAAFEPLPTLQSDCSPSVTQSTKTIN